MDLKSLKRKELQALCKKHGIPANSTSSQMIETLSSILENHDKVKPKGFLKGSGGGSAEDLGVVGGNLKKKVTFVVEDEEDDEVEEIARNPVGNSKRKSVANEVVGIERRSTRSRGLAEAVLWSPVIEKMKKKSMRVGTEGVRRNGKPILSKVSSTRSLRNRVVVAGGDEELVTDQNSRRTQERKGIAEKKVSSLIEDEVDDEFAEITRNPVGNSKRKSGVNDAVEIERRSTRSPGLAEAVLLSPVIEKTTKKSLRDGTEGVRRNDMPISSEVPATRSLRNRVVVVGGEEELENDQNSRRTQKRKISDKKEENEMVASKLEGDEFVGRKNLRKRSRGGDFVGDEAPNRMSSRNHAKSEVNVADLEKVDVGRSMKRRKRDTDSLLIEEGVDENIERANRTKGMVVNSNAVESGDVNNAEGQKKVRSRGKTRASNRGGPTTLTLETEVVILPARRSTRSSSLVGKSDEEVEAVKKEKLQKHVKDGADGEFVSEPVRRSTQSFSTSQEHGSSLPVSGLPVEGAKGHGLKGGEVIAEPSQRSTRSSSVVGKSDEEGRASKKGRSQKGGLPDSEVVAEPIRRSTRASSTLQEDGASLLVAKSVSVGEVVKKSKSQKQAKGHGSKGGGSTTSLRDSEAIAEPIRRSTRSSSSLLENGTSLPVVEAVKEVKSQKLGKGRALKGQVAPLSDNEASPMRRSTRSSSNLPENEAVTDPEMRSTRGSPKLLDGETFSPIEKGNMTPGDHASKMDDHATTISTRRSTSSSSKLLKEGSVPNIETFGSENEVRMNKSGKKLKNFDLIASVPDNEPVTTPSRILTRSSSELLENRNFLEAVSKSKLGKKSRNSASKEGDPTAMVSGSLVVSESIRRSTRSYLKHISLEVETSSSVGRKKTRKDQREDDLEGQRSEIRAQTKSLEEHEQSKELLRRSVGSTFTKNVLGGDKVEASKSDGAISVSDPPVAGTSFDLSIDVGSSNAETEFNDAVDKNVHEIRQSLAKVEKGTSLVGSAKDLGDMCLGSPTNGNQSSGFELANKGSGALPVNVEGSSETEENVSKLFPIEPSSTIEANSEPAAPSKISKELSATFDTEISTMAHPKEPDSMVKVGVERDNVITGCETKHVSSSEVPKSSEELSLRTDSHTSQGIDLEERLEAEIRGASEDGLGYDEGTDILVPTLVCKSSEELTLTVVAKADPEIDLKEPDSKVEDDGPCEDVVADDEAMNIFDPLTSDTEVCSDSYTSQGTDFEEPRLKPEICGANEDDLQDNEEKYIVVQTLVCKSSEELTQTSITVANPEIDLKEPDSKVKVDHPSEDIIGDEAKKIFIPMTSDTEVCAETLCDINVVGSDSKVEVHDASKGDMEQNEATTTVSSVMSCKSTGILSPTSLNEASPHSDLGQVDIPAMNKEASHSEGSLTEASDCRCKTLEVSMTVDGNPGDTSSRQTIFDNEVENCKANPDILKSHLEHRECDTVNNIEAAAYDKYPQLYEDLEVMKETWVSSTVSVTVNDGTEIDNDREDAEKNENETLSSLPIESHAVEGTQSSSEELVGAEQSDFTHSLYEKESGDSVKKLRVSFDDEFSAEHNDSLKSPVAFMKSEGTSYAAPLEHKDEPSAFEIAEVSTEITEDKYSVAHRRSSQLLDASSESEKQMEKDYKLCDADVESKGYSALSNENTSVTDAVLFGDVKKLVDQGDLPTLPVTFTCGEEMPSRGTEAPTLSGNEGLTMQVDIQGFSYIHGSDSTVEVHDASKGDMEQNEVTTTVSSVMSCKSTGILSPNSLNEASPHSDLGQVGIPAMNKEASHFEGSLTEASDIHCKTLEVSMILDGNPGDTSSPQTIFDNEMENCKANPDIMLKSHLEHRECDTVNNIVAVACDKYPQLYEDLEVMKETWVSSTVSVTVNDGTEFDNDRKDAEKNENESRSSFPMESHAVEGIQSSSEELVDAEQSDFTDSLYEKETGDAEQKLRDSFDDEFSAEHNDSLMSPVVFMKSEGTSYAAPLEHKDEPSAFGIAEVSTELTEDKYSAEHRRSSQLLDASSESEKQMDKDYKPCDADVESKGYSASSIENTSLTDAVLFGDVKKLVDHGDLPSLPVTFTCGEEMPLSGTEAPTLSGNEGLTMQVDIQKFSYIHGSDSKVEVHDASKGDMEQNEATTTVSSVMSCKSTGILSPTSLNEASPHSDLGQVDIPAMNKEASHSEGSLPEASDIHWKTLEVSMTVDGNPGDTSSPQTIFDNETKNCKANPDIILKSHLEHMECDAVNNFEAVACDKYPQLYEDLEVMKETWVSSTVVSSTVSVTVNDGTEIDNDWKDAEKNENELRSSLPMESHAVEGTQSSSEELVDAEQSDFTHSLYEKESGDAEKKLRVSFDDEFSAENNDSLMSPVAFMKPEGTSYAASLEHKDEPSAFEIAEVSTEITEDKYSVEHRGSSQLLDDSSESEKQMEKDYKLCDADVESEGYSASSNENTSLTDAVLFGDVKKLVVQGDLPTLPVTFTCGEEMPLSGTEAPALSGNEGLTMQVDIQGFSCIHDNEDERNLSDRQEVTVNLTENLGLDIVDRSSKLAAKKHVDVEQLNVHSDALPENSIIVNKLTDVEFERTTILGAVVSEEMDNIGSLESEDNAVGYDGTKADGIEPDKVDLLDDVGQKRDKVSLLQEIKRFSGELHTDEDASHTSFNNSASESVEERVLLAEKISLSTCLQNAPSLPKMDIVLPREAQLDEDSSEKTSAEDDTLNGEEFLSTSNFIPLAVQQECQDNNLEEHAVDNDIDMSVSGLDRYFGVLDEQSNKFQGTYESFFSGTFEGFEQASNADEACVAHCEALTEKSFHMNDEAAASMNENVELGECEHREENLSHGRCEEFSEIDSPIALTVGEDEVKGVVSGSSAAVVEEPSPSECEFFSRAEKISSASPKTFAGLDAQEQNKQNTHDQVEDNNECAQNPSYYQKL